MTSKSEREPRDNETVELAKQNLKADHHAFMSEAKRLARKAEFTIRSRNYECIARMASAIEYYLSHPAEFRDFLRRPDFPKVRTAPKGVYMSTAYYLSSASNKSEREKASREARAIKFMMNKGIGVAELAHELSADGGVSGALEMAKAQEDEGDEREDDVEDEGDEQEDEGSNLDDDDDDDEADEASSDAVRPKVRCPPAPKGYTNVFVFIPDDRAEEAFDADEIHLTIKTRRLPSGFVVMTADRVEISDE